MGIKKAADIFLLLVLTYALPYRNMAVRVALINMSEVVT